MAAVARHGIFTPTLMPVGAYVRPSHFPTTQHGERGLLRHSRWPRR